MPVLPRRDEVPVDQTWNLADIYASPEEWADEFRTIDEQVATLAAYEGRLGDGAWVLLAFFRARDDVAERFEKLGAYARLSTAGDGTASSNQAMAAQMGALEARTSAALSFVSLELLALPDGKIESYLGDEAGLGPYRKQLADILRRRGHVLSADAERAIAALGDELSLAPRIWRQATTTDLVCGSIEDETGQSVPMSIARYQFGFAQAPDRAVRRRAYESLTAGLDRHKNTLATALATHIRQNVVLARLRGYGSATEMILAEQDVPIDVYRMVLQVVHYGMAPHVLRLNQLRQRLLGIEQMHLSDLAAPLDPGFDPPTTFAEAERLIRDGLRPLGEDYAALVGAAFANRWIDRADNVGKSSGAFCSPVRLHPYVLLTWQDRLRLALVLAHELGHAGHSALASRSQLISNAGTSYAGPLGCEAMSLFFVEGPSTVNELLVGQYLLETTEDPRLRRFVILQVLGTFIHNMVTHLLEAHFEQRLYDLAEADQPITTQVVLDTQAEVFQAFYVDSVVIDDGARLYWAQQPHFYVNLYPYTYSVGLTCAYNVVENIHHEGQPAVDRWLETLRAGATLAPLDLAKRAGVDLTSPEPFQRTVAYFGKLVEELEASFPAVPTAEDTTWVE